MVEGTRNSVWGFIAFLNCLEEIFCVRAMSQSSNMKYAVCYGNICVLIVVFDHPLYLCFNFCGS